MVKPGKTISLVVAHDYALNRRQTYLSPASLTTLHEAADYLNRCSGDWFVLAHGNTNDQGEMLGRKAIEWRKDLLEQKLRKGVSQLPVLASNTFDEVRGIRDELKKRMVYPKDIHIFVDRWRTKQVELLWQYFFPKVPITIHTVTCPWGSDQAHFLQRYEILWAMVNVVATFLMRLIGIRAMKHIRQSRS